jgi:hypothetical protein
MATLALTSMIDSFGTLDAYVTIPLLIGPSAYRRP